MGKRERAACDAFLLGLLAALTGTFSGGCFRSMPGQYARLIHFLIRFNSSDWTKIVITIPGDAGGTWVMSGNGGAIGVMFDLGSGASRRGAAGAWATIASAINGATGTVSVVGTNGANFGVTGVKLEIGSVATPYNRQSLAKSLADCQRYYQTSGNVSLEGYSGSASSTVGGTIWFQVQMRAFPTLVHSGESYSNGASVAFDQITQNNFQSVVDRQFHRTVSDQWDVYYHECGALIMTYTLTAQPNVIVRDSDQAFIPTDPDNMDYAEFLAWCDEGNEPTAYEPPSAAKAERTK